MSGYELSIGPVRYSGWRDGRPFSLVDCWVQSYGCGGVTIYRPNGSVVLRNAGALSTRSTLRRCFNG